MSASFDCIIIGAGPAGYVAAIRAAQLGMNVACIEKEPTLGGTCLNVGCIPSKALLESSEYYHQAQQNFQMHGIEISGLKLDWSRMQDRKVQVVKQLTQGISGLFKKNKITRFEGKAKLSKDRSVEVQGAKGTEILHARYVILATGSVPIEIPGFQLLFPNIVDSTGALSLPKIPEKMVVIGAGAIGLELGSVYKRLGAEVTVIEAFDRICPSLDQDLSKALERILKKQGIEFLLSTQVKAATVNDHKVTLALSNNETRTVDTVLVAVGRRPYTAGLGLEECGIETDEKGRVSVNKSFETTLPGVYAIGDLIHGPMLAHKASEEGVALVEMLAGQAAETNPHTIPNIIYTNPEVASVGFTEEQLKASNRDYKTFKYPFLANGRALALGEKDGFVKLIADAKTDRLLGAHLLGPKASELIAELVVALEFSASAEDLARTIHAHPTLAEAIKEAALGLGTGAIHV